MESGALAELTMVPFQTVRFQLKRARRNDATRLQQTLASASHALASRVEIAGDGALRLRW